jgi:hypothetical protein
MQQMTSVQIDLVYDRACPHVDEARATIRAAIETVESEIEWREWDREDSRTPAELRGYGSPTVLINGRDVVAAGDERTAANANSCRVYFDECSCICGAPPAALVERAIREAQDK